jgi:thiol-disulfide isomerase/thioredoxin
MKRIIITFIMMASVYCFAQQSYKAGDWVADFRVKKVLNSVMSETSLKELQGNITIIDFFGTWCVPCIKALPALQNYQATFKEELKVILVSIEDQAKLSKFIAGRSPFPFPIVVDENRAFTNAFQPPAYPFTVVLDKNRKVLAITDAAELTEALLRKFIEEGKALAAIPTPAETEAFIIDTPQPGPPQKPFVVNENNLVKLSQDFMYASKTGDAVEPFLTRLKDMDYHDLQNKLVTDDEKMAFWINLYNAYTSVALHNDPEQYKKRSRFFKKKNIVVAGKTLSLDKIEHGILRRSKIKWSLGYFSKWFPGKAEKQLRVNKLDYRIHFALNCGAKSCPPIAFYNPASISKQLDQATRAYLGSEARYNYEKNTLYLPAIISWFRRDFGGKKKVVSLMRSLQLVPFDAKPQIKFNKYNWALYLDNYKQ